MSAHTPDQQRELLREVLSICVEVLRKVEPAGHHETDKILADCIAAADEAIAATGEPA